MKLPVIAITLSVLSAPAFACFDRDAVTLKDGYAALRAYSSNNASFSRCLDKLEDAGVDLKQRDLIVKRKQRPENEDTGPAYTILVQGKDRADRTTRLTISYNIGKHRFECGEPTHNIPRCM